jgi:DNA-directed RNA polymerase subunit RPC12/RpoP
VLSVLLIILIFGWAFLAIILVLCGWIIGLLVALVLIPFVYGYANTFVMEIVWTQNMDHEWKVVFIHGLFLFIVLLVVGLPVTLANYVFHSTALVIILFLVYIPINGYIAKKIGDGYIVAMETVQLGVPPSPAWMNKAPLEVPAPDSKSVTLGTYYYCSNCRSQVQTEFVACPNCGHPPVKKLCPGCRKVLPYNLSACTFCGYQFVEAPSADKPTESQGIQVVTDSAVIGLCPQCGREIHNGMNYCGSCGWKVVSAELLHPD